jgi:hypothetical protein
MVGGIEISIVEKNIQKVVDQKLERVFSKLMPTKYEEIRRKEVREQPSSVSQDNKKKRNGEAGT